MFLKRETEEAKDYPGPEVKRLLDDAAKYLTCFGARPLALRSALGVKAFDADGKAFLDFASGLHGNQTGHSHPAVVQALIERAQELTVSYGFGYVDEKAIGFAQRLLRAAPGRPRGPVTFTCSGASALAFAVESAKNATGRTAFAAFDQAPVGGEAPAAVLPYPFCYRCPAAKDPGACELECLDGCLEVLDKNTNRNRIAAVIFPPVLLADAFALPDADYPRELEAALKKRKVILIADETVSGGGRTGKVFASSHYRIAPDITVGAGPGPGASPGAVIFGTRHRAGRTDFDPADPIDVAASLAALELVEKEFVTNARSMGEYLLKRLREITAGSPEIGLVQGKGLIGGFEFVTDPETKEPDPARRDETADKCLAEGLLVAAVGRASLVLAPPLVITKEHVDTAVGIIAEAL